MNRTALVLSLALGSVVVATSASHAEAPPLHVSCPDAPHRQPQLERSRDLVPIRVTEGLLHHGTLQGVFAVRSDLQTEIEYGITDRVEAAWYFAFQQGFTGNTPFFLFDGVKQRVRFRVSDVDWPVESPRTSRSPSSTTRWNSRRRSSSRAASAR